MNNISLYMLPVVTAILGWLGSNVRNRRDKKQTDLKIINDAITPLLKSIKELTDHSQHMTGQLLQEQAEKLALLEEKNAWLAERIDLESKIDKLIKRIASLEKEVRKQAMGKDPSNTPELEFKNEQTH